MSLGLKIICVHVPQAPHAAPGQRQMGTFYTWPYFSYWEVMQANFLWRLVNGSYRLHNKFHFFFVVVVKLFVILWSVPVHAKIISVEVYSRSCIGLGLRAALFTFISSHSLPLIHIPHHADGGVGNSSFLSHAPSSACAITFHSFKPASVLNTLMHSSLLITSFLIPCSLHLPLITTFSIPCSLHMPLITTFTSLVVGLWVNFFGRRN